MITTVDSLSGPWDVIENAAKTLWDYSLPGTVYNYVTNKYAEEGGPPAPDVPGTEPAEGEWTTPANTPKITGARRASSTTAPAAAPYVEPSNATWPWVVGSVLILGAGGVATYLATRKPRRRRR